jgi:hypothetical protein
MTPSSSLKDAFSSQQICPATFDIYSTLLDSTHWACIQAGLFTGLLWESGFETNGRFSVCQWLTYGVYPTGRRSRRKSFFNWFYFNFVPITCVNLFFPLFLLPCWGYIVTFIKVLTIYQIYHTWICPLHHSPLSPQPHSWNSFKRSHFSIYTHVYTVFALYSCSHTLSPHPPPPTGTTPPTDRMKLVLKEWARSWSKW